MAWLDKLRDKMDVFGDDNQRYGALRSRDNRYYLDDREIDESMIERVDNKGVYLRRGAYRPSGAQMRGGQQEMRGNQGEVRVPVAEERITAGTRPTETGYVEVEKHVTEEQQSIPVETRSERAHVERRDIDPTKPLSADQAAEAFKEGTIRVPLRGEEVVAQKDVVQTGEVVITKDEVRETQTVTDNVRKETIEVDEHYNEARSTFEQEYSQRNKRGNFEEAEPNYRYGYSAARDPKFQGKRFEDVEPDLRSQWEQQNSGQSNRGRSGKSWEDLREEIRQGFSYRS